MVDYVHREFSTSKSMNGYYDLETMAAHLKSV